MILRLLRRDRPAECGVADGYVLILDRAEPGDITCREPLRDVPLHCNRCGQVIGAMCPSHGPRCHTCTLAGDPIHTQRVQAVTT